MIRNFLPAVLFFVVAATIVHGPWGAQRIAHKLEASVTENIAAAGHEWASARTNGQTAFITGEAPDEPALRDAERAAMTAIGPGGPIWGAVTRVVMQASVATPSAAAPPEEDPAEVAPERLTIAASEAAAVPSQSLAVSPAEAAENCEIRLNSVTSGQKLVFSFNNSTLTPEDQALLREIASIAAGCGPIELIVEGHTDSRGPHAVNLALSRRRAEAVRDFLDAASDQAFPIVVKAFGESQPVAPNTTKSGRQANRRIEFSVAPAGDHSELE